ncbi:facilitated trehalose transporter Tret1-like isoform X2 [Sitodiplosis mosellana]|uniref:facilitated trehalose transporter Tret1-like isoform X2 n=1 Tax=Sitodiplosis mosellana TaxID=263140 RepID=UPI002444E72D|nr:facilitated trehalose transporter Tret1-like isoform X2 [Sitodiplosis mosellana]
MSGRENKFPVTSGAMGRLMNKIKRTVSEADEKRDPLQRGYSRVETADGSLSNSSTSTSLDTVVVESAKDSTLLSGGTKSGADQQQNTRVPFSPILETEDVESVSALNNLSITSNSSTLKTFENPLLSNLKKSSASSKPSLKGSKVSFEQPDIDSDDSFEDRRGHFQQKKSLSTSVTDRKGILKDLKNSRLDADRRAFQSKKHVSLDIKNSKILERILNGSSSEEEFTNNRKHFQSRKHQSLDARVKLNLNKGRRADSSDEDIDEKGNLLQERIYDFSKPIVIDFKDLEASEDDEEDEEEVDEEQQDKEDFESARSNFQKQKTISLESRKSIRFFEMDDMSGRKGENIRQAVPFVRQITQDGKPKLEVYRTTTNPIYYYSQVLAALSVSMGSLVVGFSSGYTSPALPSMQNPNVSNYHKVFDISEDQASWAGGIMPLAGLAGGIAGGPLIEFLGRKTTILATSVPFVVAWLLIASAVEVWMVLAGRALSGFCVGIASLSLPVYLGETVQAEVRGTLGLLPTAFGNIGILLCFVAGRYMNWSQLAYLGGTLPIPFLLLMLIIPETPRWYVSRGKDEQARKALQWLRGKQADVEPELKGIIKTHTDSERHSSSNGIMQLLRRNNLKPLGVSLGLMFFQQFSDSTVHFICWHDIDIGLVGRLLLSEGSL